MLTIKVNVKKNNYELIKNICGTLQRAMSISISSMLEDVTKKLTWVVLMIGEKLNQALQFNQYEAVTLRIRTTEIVGI